MTLPKKSSVLAIFFCVAIVSFFSSIVLSSDIKKMNKEELMKMMNNDDVSIIDVRRGKDWSSSEFKIKNAVRVDPSNFAEWANSFPKDKTLVLYCA